MRKLEFDHDSAAQLITTEMEWQDLVLPTNTLSQLKEIETRIRSKRGLLNDWGFGRKLRPGFRCLFHGSPGTGKTLSAGLIGKSLELDVCRIDLAKVVSKYIGETEKNLKRIFKKAEKVDCVLFFDETDALFGKRTGVKDAHDRHANQEVSYLLQRMEQYSGLVILATNSRSNIDEAFTRRFQSVVHFPRPNASER